jgi:hypothetical protein
MWETAHCECFLLSAAGEVYLCGFGQAVNTNVHYHINKSLVDMSISFSIYLLNSIYFHFSLLYLGVSRGVFP